MPIDRIGKSVAAQGVGAAGSSAPSAAQPAAVEAARFAPAPGATEPAAPRAAAQPSSARSITAFDQLRTGAITLAGYLDLKTSEATAHLVSLLPPARLQAVRTALRERLATDPTLADLVRTVAGAAPPAETVRSRDD
ncbi:MAG: hypothetical protein FWD17_15775 [Polyangiaceae bacterium]|nr:hypothetical protein [Polyangiaceae bacterium]